MSFTDIDNLKKQYVSPGWTGRFVNSVPMTFAYFDAELDAADVPEHSHPNEEVWHVLDGELEVTINCACQRVGPGCVAVVPSNILHSVHVVRATKALVVDHPKRGDFGSAKTLASESP